MEPSKTPIIPWGMDAPEDELLRLMAIELEQKDPMDFGFLGLRPQSVLQIAGLIELALKHPDVAGSVRETGNHFVTAIRHYFADCPAVLECLRRSNA